MSGREVVETQAVRAALESPYLFAIVLCKESADALRQRTTARFASNVYCHHITLLFFRTDWRRDSFHCDPLASADWKTLGARVGSTATIFALLNKERCDDKVQAVPVVFADASLRTHPAPHVTISGRAKQASWLWKENEGEPDVKSNDDVVELRGTIVLETAGGAVIDSLSAYLAWAARVTELYAPCVDCPGWHVAKWRGCSWCGWHLGRAQVEGERLRRTNLELPVGDWNSSTSGPAEVEDGLYVGGAHDIAEALCNLKVTHVICLEESATPLPAGETADYTHYVARDDFKYLATIEDAIPSFGLAVDAVAELVRRGAKVLVHCKMGYNRSVAVVLGMCVRHRHLTYEKALAHLVKARGPYVLNNVFFRLALLRWEAAERAGAT
jgi:protein-tyrosine phosphatase